MQIKRIKSSSSLALVDSLLNVSLLHAHPRLPHPVFCLPWIILVSRGLHCSIFRVHRLVSSGYMICPSPLFGTNTSLTGFSSSLLISDYIYISEHVPVQGIIQCEQRQKVSWFSILSHKLHLRNLPFPLVQQHLHKQPVFTF